MTDVELSALVAHVNAGIVEASFANADRARKDQAPAYGEDWVVPGSVELGAELRRRGVLATSEERAAPDYKCGCAACAPHGTMATADLCSKDKPNG